MSNNSSVSIETQKFDAIIKNSDAALSTSGGYNGAMSLTYALVANATAIQDLVNKGLMVLQEKIAAFTLQLSETWIGKLQVDQSKMNSIIVSEAGESGDDLTRSQQQMTTLSAQANLDNTQYNTQTTARNGYNDMLAQVTQNTNDTVSNNFQMIQQGTISVQTNIAQHI